MNLFTTIRKAALTSAYVISSSQQMSEEWRIGKKQTKLNAIDHSRIFDLPKPHKTKAFIKYEINVEVPSKARLIQGNQNEVTAYEFPEEYASFKHALEELNNTPFEYQGVKYEFVYAGGMNHDQLSDLITQWEAEGGPNRYWDERDGKNWDSTMNEQLLKEELRVYFMLKMQSALRFYQRSSCTKGVITCKTHRDLGKAAKVILVRYLTAWKRLSGDWNTTSGNTPISMNIVFNTVMRLPEHLRPKKVQALFMGDDLLARMEYVTLPNAKDLCDAMNHYDSLSGITPVRALFTDILQVSFISMGVWPRRAGGYQFVPHPGKQLCKLFWTTKSYPVDMLVDMASQIAESFWMTYRGFPLMMQFLKLHYRGKTKQRFDQLELLGWGKAGLLTETDRDVNWQEGFVYKYRIPYSACSFEIDHVGVQHHPVVEHMYKVEALDPAERLGALGVAQ
jgi:hypothetical protein